MNFTKAKLIQFTIIRDIVTYNAWRAINIYVYPSYIITLSSNITSEVPASKKER